MSFPRALKLLISSLIGFVILLVMGSVLFSEEINYKNFRKIQQRKIHGQILNNSNHPVRIVESKRLYTVPPGKSSLDIGIHDADGFMIDAPLIVDKDKYYKGVFKFCDFSHLTLRSTPSGDILLANPGTSICRITGDYGLYKDLDTAFD